MADLNTSFGAPLTQEQNAFGTSTFDVAGAMDRADKMIRTFESNPNAFGGTNNKNTPQAFAQSFLNTPVTSTPYSPVGYTDPVFFSKERINFDRYYNHPEYNNLGFHPFRDNETYYNENSHWTDDYSRMGSQFGTLFASGLVSTWDTIADVFTGDNLAFDDGLSKAYEKASRIGTSSRGGLVGFGNNLLLNSAYTLGIVTDFALTELALAGITYATGGAASGATGTLGAAKAASFAEHIAGVWDVFKATNSVSRMRSAASAAQDASKLRQFFNATATALNPLENTITFGKSLVSTESELNKLSNLGKVSSGFGSFFRDVKKTSMAWSESKLEAGMVEQDVRQNLIDKYVAENGFTPVGEDLRRIEEASYSSGITTAMANFPLIYGTNAITFGTLFKGYKPLREATDVGIDRLIRHEADVAGRRIVTRDAPGALKQFGELFTKPSLKKTFGYLGRYTSANFSEGVQEIGQEIIAGAAKDYYENIFDRPAYAQARTWSHSLEKASKDMLSAQGAEIFFSGFLMGGVAGPYTKMLYGIPNMIQRVADPTAYKNLKEQQKKTKEELKAIANEVGGSAEKLDNFWNSVYNAFARQQSLGEEATAAATENNQHAFQNAKDKLAFDKALQLMKSGALNEHIGFLQQMKDLTEEELKEAFPQLIDKSKEEGIAKIEELIQRFEGVAQNYTSDMKAYKNPFRPFDLKKDNPAYQDELTRYYVWEELRRQRLFYADSYQRHFERIDSMMQEAKSDPAVAAMAFSDYALLYDPQALAQEIETLEAEVKIEATTDEQKELLERKKERLAKAKAFGDALIIKNDGTLNKNYRTRMFKAYMDFLNHVANGEAVDEGKAKAQFELLYDALNLRDDAAQYQKMYNFLADPKSASYQSAFTATQDVMTKAREAAANHMSKLVDDVEGAHTYKALFEVLARMGVVIDKEDLEAFVKAGTKPRLRSAESGNILAETDQLHQAAMGLINSAIEKKQVKEEEETQSAPVLSEEEMIALEDIAQLDSYFQNLIETVYKNESSRRKSQGLDAISFNEFVASERGQAVVNALLKLNEAYAEEKSTLAPADWLKENMSSEDVDAILQKAGLNVQTLLSYGVAPNTFAKPVDKNNAIEGNPEKTLMTPKGEKGLFVRAQTDEEGTVVYELIDNQDNVIPGSGAFLTLEEAVQARKELASKRGDEAESFVFDNKTFKQGDTVNDGRGNNYTVVTSAAQMIESQNKGETAGIVLKRADGSTVKRTSATNIFPGTFGTFKENLAYINDLNNYNQLYGFIEQEDRDAAERGDFVSASEAATARMKTKLAGLSNEDINGRITVKITENDPGKRWQRKLRIQDKENPNLDERSERYSIMILLDGQALGFIRSAQNFQFIDAAGKALPLFARNEQGKWGFNIPFDVFSRTFNAQGWNMVKAYEYFRTAMSHAKNIQANVNKIMKGQTDVELSNEETIALLGKIQMTAGSYDFAKGDDRATFGELSQTTIEGGTYIIDARSSVQSGVYQLAPRIITDLTGEERERAEAKINAALEEMKARGSSPFNMGRYILAIEMNGEVRFVPFVSRTLTEEETTEVFAQITAISEDAKANNKDNQENYTDAANQEAIYDKLYHSHAGGFYSRMRVTSEGLFVVEVADNPSFNYETVLLSKDLQAEPLTTMADLVAELNAAVPTINKKFKGIIFKDDMLRVSLPQDITTEQFKSGPVVATVSAEIIKADRKALFIPVFSGVEANLSSQEDSAPAGGVTATGPANDLLGGEVSTAPTTAPVDAAALIAQNTVAQIPVPAAPTAEQKNENQQLVESLQTAKEELKQLRKRKTDSYMALADVSRAEASRAIDNDPEVIAKVQQISSIEADINSRANKVVPLGDDKFTQEEVEKIEEFRSWVKRNLPDAVTIEVLDTLINNLHNGHVTVGQFVMRLAAIGQGIEGVIKVSALSPAKYHEAFHAVFRLFLTDEEISRYLAIARIEVRESLRKQGKTLPQAIVELRATSPIYNTLTDAQVEERLYEEHLADKFQEWKTNKKTNTSATNKSMFRKIMDFIKEFFRSFSNKASLANLFESIDSGKYSNKTIENNRFTSVFEEGGPVVANKTIKIGTGVVTTADGSLKKFNKYLGGDRAGNIIAGIASQYMLRRQKAENEVKTDQEIYDSIISDYLNEYDYDSDIYRNEPNFEDIREDLEMMYSLFDDTKVVEQLIDAAQEYIDVMQYIDQSTEDEIEAAVDDLGDVSTTDSRQETESIGGFKSLSSKLRLYIATTAFSNVNEYGKNLGNLATMVEAGVVYNGLMKALAGAVNETEALMRLQQFNIPGTQTGAFVTRLFQDTGVVFENGVPRLDALTNPELLLSVLKGFEKFKINYKYIGLDPKTRTIRILDANRRDDTRTIFSLWNAAFERKKKYYGAEFNTKASASIEKLVTLINNVSTDSKQIQETLTELELVTGIRLSNILVNYTIAVNTPLVDRTEEQSQLIHLNRSVEPINTEGLTYIATDILNGGNTFSKQTATETDIEGAKSSGGRVYALAKSASAFDETVGANSWVNAEGETVYGYQSPTFNHKRFEEIKTEQGLINLFNDLFTKNNFLLNSEAFKSILPGLQLERIDGMRLEYLAQSVSEVFKRGDTFKQGTTLGSMSPMEYAVTNLALYGAGETLTFRENGIAKSVTTSVHNVGVIEASNTADVVALPVSVTVNTKDGKTTLTETAVDKFANLIETEMSRIERVSKDTKETLISQYNTPSKGGRPKGMMLSRTIPYVGELRARIEEGAAEGKTLFEVVSREELREQLENFTETYVKKMRSEFMKEGLLRYDDKAKKYMVVSGIPSFISDGFTTVEIKGTKGVADKAKNSALNLIPGNIYHNLAQIIVNDVLNTAALSILMKGDIAKSVKMTDEDYYTMIIDEIKRNKGLNASGVSAYTRIAAKNLGIMHETAEFDVATIDDPTVLGKYTGKSVDLADAQTWGTVKALRHMLFGFGKLTEKQARFLDKIENGEDFTADEIFGKNGSIRWNHQTNSLKIVYYDGQTYIKTSFFVLTKALTSNPKTNYQTARPGREKLHALRIRLEGNDAKGRLSIAVPVSASKGMKVNVAANVAGINDETFAKLNAKFLTLQQENPSNKIEITDTTQIKQLATLEQGDVMIRFRGVDIPAAQLVKLYDEATAARVTIKYGERKMTVFGFRELLSDLDKAKAGQVSADLTSFAKYASEILKGTGGSAQAIDLFELDENGNLKADLNNSIVEAKFIELYMSYFTKGVLREKVPGHALTLVSNFGIDVVKEALEVDKNGNVTKWRVLSDAEALEVNIQEEGTALQKGMFYTASLAHDVPVYDEAGNDTGERYTEVLIPAHFKELHNWEGEIPETIARMFGVRIPSQDKHSTVNIRVVGFLPSFYGSVIVAPHELIEISGADFDVDKLYAQIKEWYTDKDGGIREYGKAQSDFGRYLEYLRWQLKNNKQVRDLVKEESVETLEELVIDALAFVRIKTQDRKNLSDKLAAAGVALEQLGLPATFEQYKKAVEENDGMDIYVGALNNVILDAKIGLTFNRHTTAPRSGRVLVKQQGSVKPTIDFQEDQNTGYAERTKKNASADATIAIATDFNSAGEKLTKKSVTGQNKKYIPVDANNLVVTREIVESIVAALNAVDAKTLNIAGNGIYTMKGKYTQEQVDDFTYELLKAVIESPNLKNQIESIRTGGQTGFDEAGAKAGSKLGVPTTILAPKGWKFRNASGNDISNKEMFMARFTQQQDGVKEDLLEEVIASSAVDTAPIAYQVAHIDPIQQAIQELIDTVPGADALFQEESFDPNSLVGKYFAFKNNKEGSRNIGAAVMGNLAYAVLNKSKVSGFEKSLTSDGQRKAYIISALITAMTDNAKERLAAKAGLSIDGLSWVTMMVSAGTSLTEALLLINQPVVRKIRDIQTNSAGEFRTTDRSFKFIEAAAKQLGIPTGVLIKKLKSPTPTLTKEILSSQVEKQDALINLSIIKKISKLEEDQKYFRALSVVSGIVKGFDYEGAYKIQEAIDLLRSDGSPYDLVAIVNANPMLKQMIRIHQDIMRSLPYVFKRSTVGAQSLAAATKNNLNARGAKGAQFQEELTKDLISYFDIVAYKNYLRKTGKLRALASLNNLMVYKQAGKLSVVDLVEQLRVKYPNNYFLNNFIFTVKAGEEGNTSGIDYIDTNSWTKLSQDQIQKLQNAYVELFNNDADLATDLFHYLLVKDAGRFRSGSFLNILPGFVMEDYFTATKPVLDALRTNGEVIDGVDMYMEVFGMSVGDINEQFIYNYSQNTKFTSSPRTYFRDIDREIDVPEGSTLIRNNPDGTITLSPFDKDAKGINKTSLEEFELRFGFTPMIEIGFDKPRFHAPLIIAKGSDLYIAVKAQRTQAEQAYRLMSGAGMPWGSSVTYQKLDSGIGSIKASPVGFVFGALPKTTSLTSKREDVRAVQNGSGNTNQNDNKTTTPSKTQTPAAGKVNYADQLEEQGIIWTRKGFNYLDDQGNVLEQYKGMTPKDVLEKINPVEQAEEGNDLLAGEPVAEPKESTEKFVPSSKDMSVEQAYNEQLSDEAKAMYSLRDFKASVERYGIKSTVSQFNLMC